MDRVRCFSDASAIADFWGVFLPCSRRVLSPPRALSLVVRCWYAGGEMEGGNEGRDRRVSSRKVRRGDPKRERKAHELRGCTGQVQGTLLHVHVFWATRRRVLGCELWAGWAGL